MRPVIRLKILKLISIFVVFNILLTACAPTGSTGSNSNSVAPIEETTPDSVNTSNNGATPSSSGTTAATPTPEALPVPVPYQLLPEDAGVDQISIFEWLRACQTDEAHTTKFPNGATMFTCLNTGALEGMVLSFMPLATAYAMYPEEIRTGTLTLAGVVGTAGATISGAVTTIGTAVTAGIGVIIASPVALPAALGTVAVTSLVSVAVNGMPPQDPAVVDWVAGKTPDYLQTIMAGTTALGGVAVRVDDQVGIDTTVDVGAFADRYEIPVIHLGVPAIILEDDPIHALNSYLVLRLFGMNVTGIYPNCSTWLASGNYYAKFFLVDQILANKEIGSTCARDHIRPANLGSYILLYSSLGGIEDQFLSRYVNDIQSVDGAFGAADAFQKRLSVFRFIEYLKGITFP